MADQFNTGKPALGNQISADIPDMQESLDFIWDILQNICGSGISTTDASGIFPYESSEVFRSMKVRSKFTYNGGSTAYTIKCEPAIYWCKDKYCYWDSELTTGAIGSPAADDWFYLYLDYSAITSQTAITNSELIWASTEPSWDDTHKGYYNGDDRCIFAVLCNGTPNNILPFYHDGGDYIQWDDDILERTGALAASWTNVACASSIPIFSLKGKFIVYTTYSAGGQIFYRVDDSSSSGIGIFNTSSAGNYYIVTDFFMDSTQTFELYGNTDTTVVNTLGWYLPEGI